MSIIVQKFGGTSVNTPEKREQVLAKVIAAKEEGNDVVVVVSAMGRKGEAYATDTLLDLLLQVGPEPAGPLKDLLVSCGEIISASVMAHSLAQKGYKTVALTGFQAGIITDNDFTNADIKRVETDYIKRKLQEGNIVFVAGFQGITEQGEITTLGRGGSDTTALALGGALGADKTIIYTDVPGVAWTDPRLVPEVPFLKTIGFEPMYTLAKAGAKVVHLRAVKAAMDFDCPFYIRSTFQDGEGTLVGPMGEDYNGIYGLAVSNDGIREGFSLITIVWSSESKHNSERFLALLKGQGIAVEDTSPVSNGASYLVSVEQTTKAVQCLYDFSLEK